MIVFDQVTKIYEPDVPALSDVTFHIDKGEFVFIVGASGSGKSTLVRLLLKELEPTTRQDRRRRPRARPPEALEGPDAAPEHRLRLPGLQAPAAPHRRRERRLRAEGAGREQRARSARRCPRCSRWSGCRTRCHSLPDELSGGEQQRVSIARAFVNHPPLLVCDEPTGNLDPDTSVGIMQLLYRINRSGTTILMVTHDREMVDKMRKRVIAARGRPPGP